MHAQAFGQAQENVSICQCKFGQIGWTEYQLQMSDDTNNVQNSHSDGNPQGGYQRGSSNNSLADRIVGGPQPVDRGDLLARGMTNQQVDALEVQARIAMELRDHIIRWVICFMCTLCVVGIASFGLLIWLIISWAHARNERLSCDAPLLEWVTVVYIIKVYMFFLHRMVIRCVCKYDPRENNQGPAPWYVKLYNLLFPTFDFVWNITGIILAATSKTCSENMPDVYYSILAFASCGLFIAVWFLINAVGLQVILAYMMRHGMLHSAENAAPKGTIEKQEIVHFGQHDFGDNPCCSICLEDWSAQKEIRKTVCGHCYHTTCLKGWLNVNRNCPLCRTDLVNGQGAVVGASEEP